MGNCGKSSVKPDLPNSYNGKSFQMRVNSWGQMGAPVVWLSLTMTGRCDAPGWHRGSQQHAQLRLE